MKLPKKILKKIEKLSQEGYKVIINPPSARIGQGGQYFGSGGYVHRTKVIYPEGKKLKDVVEIISYERYDNGFISGVYWKITPKIKPLVLKHYSGDIINGGRNFNQEIFVFI